jgi:preprotein translocase subunit SecG
MHIVIFYVLQAGLIQLLFKKFRMTLIICVLYIILSICLHSWHMTIHYNEPLSYFWSTTYHCLYSFQRTSKLTLTHKYLYKISYILHHFYFIAAAVLYYYLSKRASLQISDPKFHEGSNWMQKQFSLT